MVDGFLQKLKVLSSVRKQSWLLLPLSVFAFTIFAYDFRFPPTSPAFPSKARKASLVTVAREPEPQLLSQDTAEHCTDLAVVIQGFKPLNAKGNLPALSEQTLNLLHSLFRLNDELSCGLDPLLGNALKARVSSPAAHGES